MTEAIELTDQDRAPTAPTTEDPHTPVHAVVIGMKLIAGLGGAVILWVATWLALGTDGSEQSWQYHALIPTAILALVFLTIFREARYWWAPQRRLANILREIRAGQRPIEELQTVAGGLSPIAPLIEDLYRELRQQRQAVAELELEIRHRVASRTNALERQLGSLRVQATRDALTGLHNRRTLGELLPRLIETAQEKSSELSVLAIDVDNFKPLNDTLGHAAGDDLLKAIGQILRSGVREGDVVVRCGGDEFVVLLPGCPKPTAIEMGARLAHTVSTMAKTFKTPLPPGLSVGVASLSNVARLADGELTGKALLHAADQHLYDVKKIRKADKPRNRAAVA